MSLSITNLSIIQKFYPDSLFNGDYYTINHAGYKFFLYPIDDGSEHFSLGVDIPTNDLPFDEKELTDGSDIADCLDRIRVYGESYGNIND